MSICTSCIQPLTSESRTMQMPCCGATGHTICMIQAFVLTRTLSTVEVYCAYCSDHVNTYMSNEQDTNSVYSDAPIVMPPMTPELRAAIKVAKKASVAKNKTTRALATALKNPYLAYKAQTYPIIASLKAIHKEAILTARLTPEYREAVSSSRRYTAIVTRLMKTYGIHGAFLRTLGLRSSYTNWRNCPTRILRRKFRICSFY